LSVRRLSPSAPRTSGRAAILVFAKAPVAGKVKTRLIPALGEQGAAGLHRRLTRRALAAALRSRLGPVILFCAPDTRHGFFRQMKGDLGVPLRSQKGADLGERMHHALSFALSRHAAALLIGSDCPGIDAEYLRQAACSLNSADVPLVLGPAGDGGYVLIGARRLHRRIFTGVPWGSGQVLEVTRARLRELGWGWHELAPLEDVDRPQDLARLDPGLLG
jgi:rSAM/selenodomain-associated transferase 1